MAFIVRVAAAGIAGLALAGCTPVVSRSPSFNPASDAIKAAGFTELLVASTAYGPGSLVVPERGSSPDGPLQLRYICDPQYMKIPAPLTDNAMTTSVAGKFQTGFKFQGEALGLLGLSAEANYIDAVMLKFSNVAVLQHADDTREAIRGQLGPICKKNLERYASQNIAFQTAQALKADVEYTAEFKADASAEVKQVVIAKLTAGLGGSISSQSDSAATGKGLFYGLNLEPVR